jgi:phenylpropionate dioxygenase-like ring-hydroxylating dioxygenase large terminal subunit
MLLGHTYVVWFDPKAEQGEGKWRLMEDRCPHRWVGTAPAAV